MGDVAGFKHRSTPGEAISDAFHPVLAKRGEEKPREWESTIVVTSGGNEPD